MSTPSVVLTGYPPILTWPGEYPTWYPPVLTWSGGTLLGGTLPRGYPTWGVRVPYLGTPILTCLGGTLPGYPPVLTWLGGPCWGVPYLGPPILTWLGSTLLGGTLPGYPLAGYPRPDLAGYAPQLDLAGYPPGVCPMEFWVMLQSIMAYGYPPPPVSAPWHSGKCCKALWDMGTPPVDRQIDGWKDRHVSKHYLPVVLRTRAVKIETPKIHH